MIPSYWALMPCFSAFQRHFVHHCWKQCGGLDEDRHLSCTVVDDTTSSQAQDPVSFMEVLGLSQFVLTPMHQADHTQDLIFGIEF